jgi:glucoamylase
MPGIAARWTSSAKEGVGTSISKKSRVWFTVSHGIFNEIYYPRIDRACVRDMELIVTHGANFFSEEKRDTVSRVHWIADGVPGFHLFNTCHKGRYSIEKQIVTDPRRDTVLQWTRFLPSQEGAAGFGLYVLLSPHLGNQGGGNSAWLGDYEGTGVLLAERDGSALALACSVPWKKRSVGYVGFSDGWQDLKAHNGMTWEYTRAEDGNVALTAEIDLHACHGEFVLALGFGADPGEAARNAVLSLRDGFERARHDYVGGWQDWMKTHDSSTHDEAGAHDLSLNSLAVLRTHESKSEPGGLIASLSIPWGFSKGDNDLGGYHLVWARDMVETAGGLLAAGAHEELRRVLAYLRGTQRPDGHWPQNMWLDGTPYWDGIQMDETALPILLVDLAYREKALSKADLASYWPMARQAAAYLVRNGPVSPQDRWEEDPGYSPFTVGAEIAALLVSSEMAMEHGETSVGIYLQETADVWNSCIERWMFATETDWCQKYAVEGYYVRIAPTLPDQSEPGFHQMVDVKNVSSAEDARHANHLISPDALALVRFGVRSGNDPRIRSTVTVIDALLKVETPTGLGWHRYNEDGYGEHEDGAPFDGTGIGRLWPLLTGERAHFELASGDFNGAKDLMAVMGSYANQGGLIPEQVWDSPDIPGRELYFGRPSGSAMPLVWAHAEYLKLRRSIRDDRVFDMPPQTRRRYVTERHECPRMIWRFNHKLRSIPAGKDLRIETLAPAVIHWSADDWKTVHDVETRDSGIGVHFAEIEGTKSSHEKQIKFTFYWPQANRWEGKDFVVRIAAAQQADRSPLGGRAAYAS